MKPLILHNARLTGAAALPQDSPRTLRVQHGRVEVVDSDISTEDADVTDLGGAMVSAGWIDLFADYREPGWEQKETIRTGLDAAAAGGFTAVGLLPNTAPAVDNRGGVQYALGLGLGSGVKLLPYGALSQGIEGKALAEMLDMRAGGAVAFTDGWKSVQNAQLLLKALEYVKAFDGLIIQLPQDHALAAGGLMHEGPLSTQLGMAGMPSIAETLAVHRDIEILRYTGSRLHLTGISTAASVELVRRAKADGLNLTSSVSPLHLLLNETALDSYDSAWKLTPPLRPEADRQALIAGLADGTIDAIASHHRPQDWDAKMKEFEYAGEGAAAQELLFPLVLKAVDGTVPLSRIADALSAAPRRILGMPAADLSGGTATDLTIFTPEGETVLERSAARSRAFNNPFLNTPLPGKVLGIITENFSSL